MSEENKLQSMVVKTLRDESGNLFAPVTTYKALINEEGQSLSATLDEKIDFADLKSGDNITITVADGYLPIKVGEDLSGASCVFNLDSFKVIDLNNNPYSGIETEIIQSAAGTTGGMSIRRGYILKTPTSSVYFEISTNSSRYTWYNLYINCSGVITHILENTTAYNGSGFDNDIVVKNGRYDFPIDFGSITEVISSNLASGIIIKEPKSATISASSDYEANSNKPLINSVELLGNKTHTDLGLQPAGDYALNSRVSELKAQIDEIASIQKQAVQAIGYDDYQKMITAINELEENKLLVGQTIYIKTKDVPDVWVFARGTQFKTYRYTTDEDVIEKLLSDTGLEIGYYTLSPLETEKINLTNYVQFTDISNSETPGVIKINENSGVYLDEGVIYTSGATEAQIAEQTNEHVVITPANLDYAVHSIISNTSDLVNDSDFVTQTYVENNIRQNISDFIDANRTELTGESGVHVGPEMPLNPEINVWIDSDAELDAISYAGIIDKPTINEIELNGNLTTEDIGLASKEEINLINESIISIEETLETKQNSLNVGTNISIENTTISALCPSASDIVMGSGLVSKKVTFVGNSHRLAGGNNWFASIKDKGITYFERKSKTWIAKNNLFDLAPIDIIFGNGVFVVQDGANNFYTAKTPVHQWTKIDVSDINKDKEYVLFSYCGGWYFLISNNGYASRSRDLINWESFNIPNTLRYTGIAYTNELFLLGTETSNVLLSTNGIDWEESQTNVNGFIYGVIGEEEWFYSAVASSGEGSVYRSRDGITWTSCSTSGFALGGGYMASGNGYIASVLHSEGGTYVSSIIRASFGPYDWGNIEIGFTGHGYDIAYDGSRFGIVTHGSSGGGLGYNEWIPNVGDVYTNTSSQSQDMSNYYSKAEVDAKIEELRSLISLATSEDIQNILTPQPEEEPEEEGGIDEGVDLS